MLIEILYRSKTNGFGGKYEFYELKNDSDGWAEFKEIKPGKFALCVGSSSQSINPFLNYEGMRWNDYANWLNGEVEEVRVEGNTIFPNSSEEVPRQDVQEQIFGDLGLEVE